MDLRSMVLDGFRQQWAAALRVKFQDNLSKIVDADMKSLAEEMFGHTFVRVSLESVGVTSTDVAQVLEDVRDEILKGVQ